MMAASTLFTVAILLSAPSPSSSMSVWPKPQSQKDTGTLHTINPASFLIESTNSKSELLKNAIRRYSGLIFGHHPAAAELEVLSSMRDRGVISSQEFATFHDRLTIARPSRVAAGDEPAVMIEGCDIDVSGGEAIKTLETDESYTLTIGAPRIKIAAKTVFGAIYALETLSQLVENSVFVNGTTIEDKPRYAFRATMIDTSRHWYPLEAILMHLDAMVCKFSRSR